MDTQPNDRPGPNGPGGGDGDMSESPEKYSLSNHINPEPGGDGLGGDSAEGQPDGDVPAHLLWEEIRRSSRLAREVKALKDTLRREGVQPPAPEGYEPFPVSALPGTARHYVEAASKALPAAPAFIALPMLSVLASGVGSAARLQLKESWNEPSTLWTGLVAPSGSTKSPAFRHAVRPVMHHEAEAKESYETALDMYDPDGDEPKPIRTRYRTGDTTPEGVIRVLQNNPRGILLARDELAAWIGSFDRYANGASDLQFWIEVWSGIQVSKDRAGDGNITVSHPSVSLTGTIQPGTLKEKITKLHFQTGFVSRMMLAMPPVEPKQWTEADVTRDLLNRYGNLLRTLYDLHQPGEPRAIELSKGAKREWVAFYNEENAYIHGLPEGPTRSARVKSITNSARLALILHLCRVAEGECNPGPVQKDTLVSALKVGKWAVRETLRVYGELELGEEALPPHERFLRFLPTQFETREAKEVAEEEGIPRSTLFDWLNKLQDSGKVTKVQRGVYRKT